MLILDMIEILSPLVQYKYDTWRILPVKCYIDNSVRLRSCIRNVNNCSNARFGQFHFTHPQLRGLHHDSDYPHLGPFS
jgi:hypothetical protein